jgi:hypothetical protein
VGCGRSVRAKLFRALRGLKEFLAYPGSLTLYGQRGKYFRQALDFVEKENYNSLCNVLEFKGVLF